MTPHDPDPIGTEEGQPCNRLPEPDEDQPSWFRPKPCRGVMGFEPVEECRCHLAAPCNACVENPLVCDRCGEVA